MLKLIIGFAKVYPHLIFLQAAATTPPPLATAVAVLADISQEAKLPAAMPADVKPAAAMARGAAAMVATAPPAPRAAISAVEPAIQCYEILIMKTISTDLDLTSRYHRFAI